jgi:hypothetical protein
MNQDNILLMSYLQELIYPDQLNHSISKNVFISLKKDRFFTLHTFNCVSIAPSRGSKEAIFFVDISDDLLM